SSLYTLIDRCLVQSAVKTVTVPDVIELQALDMWRLEVKWIMNQNEEQRNQTYEIQVGRTTNMDIVDSMNVSRGSLEAVHTLVWTSQLPLNCVDHSVRIRLISCASPSKHVGQPASAVKPPPGMFPDDQVLREGSTVMFCCIYPKETHITSMFFDNTLYKVINVSAQVKAIRVENIKVTNSFGVNFYCDRNSDVTAYNFVTCEYKCPIVQHNSNPCENLPYQINKMNFTEMLKHILCSSVVVVLQDLDKNGSDSMQCYAFRLQHLKPSTLYSVRGRCAVQGNDWGRWTTQRLFITGKQRVMGQHKHLYKRSVLTRFTLPQVSNDSESYIKAYEVCVSYRNTEMSVCMNVTQTQVELTRDINMSDITVRAVIQSGLSEPAHITIPSAYTDSMLSEKRIMGNEKGFQLTWTRDSAATCGYTIEWCMLGIALPCNLQWRKVPANQTCLNLNSGDFKAGVQYAFEIYGSSAEGHRRHEKQIGYLKEQSKSAHTHFTCHITLKWSFNEKDPSHAGFITGYVITIQDYSEVGSDLSKQSVDDPHSKSWTVSGLEEDWPYIFQLAACTSAGCGPETTATFRTRQNCELRYRFKPDTDSH
uniref:Oncostatin M receptor n=1 Tax=Sinocyclocheilus grahami TaxID=75366 RepID=A0A672MJF7_SINGR